MPTTTTAGYRLPCVIKAEPATYIVPGVLFGPLIVLMAFAAIKQPTM